MAFSTTATDIVANDTNGTADVFVVADVDRAVQIFSDGFE
jgi:hypothetical protein